MSLSRQLHGTAKPPALIFTKSGYSRSCIRSFRLSMGSRNVQAGLYRRSEPTPKTREATLPPSLGRSTAINSIIRNFRFHFRTPTHPFNGPRSDKSGQDVTTNRVAMAARRIAAINIFGFDILDDNLNLALIEATTRPALTLLIGLLPTKLVKNALMVSNRSIHRGCCICEILQTSCQQKGAQST